MKNKGITLIALVVTIIVLIILATISISALFGENGLIKRAEQAKILHEQEQERERLEMIKAEVLADMETYKGKLESNNYVEELKKQGITDDSHVTEKDGVYTVITDTGYTVTIYDNPDHDNDVVIKIGEGQEGGVIITDKIKDVTVTSGIDSLTVNVTVSTKNASGITYNYYYKEKDLAGDYQKAQLNHNLGTYTVQNLKENKSYLLKVEIVKGGQVVDTKEGIVASTKGIPSAEGTIKVSEIVWENGEPKVKVEKDSGNKDIQDLDIEYKVLLGGIDNPSEIYKPVPEDGIISGVKNGDIVEVVLSNGDTIGDHIKIRVEDKESPEVTISLSKSNVKIGEDVTAIVKQVDTKTGLDLASCKWIYNTNSSNSLAESEFTNKFVTTVASGYIEENTKDIVLKNESVGTYYLHVLSKDKAGNITQKISDKVIVADVPSAKDILSIDDLDVSWEDDGTQTIKITGDIPDALHAVYSTDGGETYKPVPEDGIISGLKLGEEVKIAIVGEDGKVPTDEDKILKWVVKDEVEPSDANISFNKTKIDVGEEGLTAKVTLKDEQSGIDILKSKWKLSTSASISENEINESFKTTKSGKIVSETIAIEKEKYLTAGKYYLYVLSVDRAGNKVQTKSDVVNVNVMSAVGVLDKDNFTYEWTEDGKQTVKVGEIGDIPEGLSVAYTTTDEKPYKKVENGEVTGLSHGEYVRFVLIDENGEAREGEGEWVDWNVSDNVPPSARIEGLDNTALVGGQDLVANVTLIDNESGINLEKCRWVFNTSKEEPSSYPDENKFTSKSTSKKIKEAKINLQVKVAGTYYLHILSVDNAVDDTKDGNSAHTVSHAVTVEIPSVEDAMLNLATEWKDGKQIITVTKTTTEDNLTLVYAVGEDKFIEVPENGKIENLNHGDVVQFALKDIAGNIGQSKVHKVEDKNEPQEAEVNFNKTEIKVGETGLTATVILKDNESGIDIAKCRWKLSTSTSLEDSEINEEFTGKGTGTSVSEIVEVPTNKYLTAGTYYLYILSVDKAGVTKQTRYTKSVVKVSIPAGKDALDAISYSWNEEGKQSVTVGTITGTLPDGLSIGYSKTGDKPYIKGETATNLSIEEDNYVYFTFLDEEGNVSEEVDSSYSWNVQDGEKPREASISSIPSVVEPGTTMSVMVEQVDYESGIKLSECKWKLDRSAVATEGSFESGAMTFGLPSVSTVEESMETEASGKRAAGRAKKHISTITTVVPTLSSGVYSQDYYLHILSVDASGNKNIKSSKVIVVREMTPPEVASIELCHTTMTTEGTVTATVSQSDKQSGIDITKCKWVFSTNTSNKLDESDFTNSFTMSDTGTEDKLVLRNNTPGTYFLHVLSVDRAGNSRQTMSSLAVTINDAGWDTSKVRTIVSSDNEIVPVPVGYVKSETSGESSVSTGFVIKEGSDGYADGKNEFVWVPAREICDIYDSSNNAGQLWEFEGELSSKSIYNYDNCKEPDVVTGVGEGENSADGDSYDAVTANLTQAGSSAITAKMFKEQLQNEFNEVRNSIQKYGGFYIGRYETGNLNTSTAVVQKYNSNITNQTWYTQYKLSKTVAVNSNVKTHMIWGSQWDATLRWLQTSNSSAVRNYPTNSASYGNYNDKTITYKEASNGVAKTKDGGTSLLVPTGGCEITKVNNIYDMAGNALDWTMEAYGSKGRVNRGDGCYISSQSSASTRRFGYPDSPNAYNGSRIVLYM